MKAKKTWVILIFLLTVTILLPQMLDAYYSHIYILILMYATLATAWNWLGGYAGQASVGHVVFFGIGAYGTALGQAWWNLNPWVGTLLGIILAVTFSILIGSATFRLRGHYFSIATIAIGEIMVALFSSWERAGAGAGVFIPIRDSSIINFQFSGKIGYCYLILGMLVLGLIVTAYLETTRPGYYFRAIKGDPDAAQAVGINLLQYKLLAIGISAALTALVGAFWANYVLFIDPASVYSSSISIQMLLIAALGGVATIWGPVIGAFILIPISEVTRMFLGGSGRGLDMVLYGGLIMLVAVIQPAGILGAIRVRREKRRDTATKKVLQPVSDGENR